MYASEEKDYNEAQWLDHKASLSPSKGGK